MSFPLNCRLAACLIFTGLCGALIAENSDSARAEYPGSFSRPPSQGRDYDTWSEATGPDVGESKVDPTRLPSRVDNSARPQFPPVYKQRWGACGQFASIASIFTALCSCNRTHSRSATSRARLSDAISASREWQPSSAARSAELSASVSSLRSRSSSQRECSR